MARVLELMSQIAVHGVVSGIEVREDSPNFLWNIVHIKMTKMELIRMFT